jgi:hypothetical protein
MATDKQKRSIRYSTFGSWQRSPQTTFSSGAVSFQISLIISTSIFQKTLLHPRNSLSD